MYKIFLLTLYIAAIIHVPLNRRRCWARKKSDCLPCDEHTYIHTYTDFRKISRRRVYFPSPIFPHPSPCRHSHFPIWWTIKRLLQQFFLSKLHSTLCSTTAAAAFSFWKFHQRKKNNLLQSWILFREKNRFVPAQKQCFGVFDSGGFFLTNFQEEIVEWKWL